MNELVGKLNNLIDNFKGGWKLECVYPFIYRGYNGENTLGIELSSMQNGKTNILMWHKRVDSTILLLSWLTVKTSDLYFHIENLLNTNLKRKEK
jgi:hypothetical protein